MVLNLAGACSYGLGLVGDLHGARGLDRAQTGTQVNTVLPVTLKSFSKEAESLWSNPCSSTVMVYKNNHHDATLSSLPLNIHQGAPEKDQDGEDRECLWESVRVCLQAGGSQEMGSRMQTEGFTLG